LDSGIGWHSGAPSGAYCNAAIVAVVNSSEGVRRALIIVRADAITVELMRDDDLAVGDTFSERELQRMIVMLGFVRLIQSTLKQQVWLRQALIYHKSFLDIDYFLRSLIWTACLRLLAK
jgi:hypothetical protein